MPGKGSLYQKIQVALEIAKSVKVSSIRELKEEIANQGPENFLTRKFSREKDDYIDVISLKSISNTLRFCLLLELLSDNGGLTDEGREALRRVRYDHVLAKQIVKHLKKFRVNFTELNKIILNCLHSTPPIMPNTAELYDQAKVEIKFSKFSKMLNLLSQCGFAESSRKKVFLSINI